MTDRRFDFGKTIAAQNDPWCEACGSKCRTHRVGVTYGPNGFIAEPGRDVSDCCNTATIPADHYNREEVPA